MSVILAYSESLKHSDIQDEKRLEFIGVINEQEQNLLNLIENLLDLSNFEISVTMLNVHLMEKTPENLILGKKTGTFP